MRKIYAWVTHILDSFPGYPEDNVEETILIDCTEEEARKLCDKSTNLVFYNMFDQDDEENYQIITLDEARRRFL